MGRWALAGILVAQFSCFRGGYMKTAQADGSCEAVCDFYVACKGPKSDGAAAATCMSECRFIFVEDNHVDRESLSEFQRLSCDEAVAYVEGPSRS